MLSIIDYNLGNILSVKKAFDYLGIPAQITKDKNEIEKSNGVVLPGVGAFPYAIKKLKENDLFSLVIDQAQKKPLLGICLGMQLLFDKSYEVEECDGLSLIKGEVIKFNPSVLKIPHMGWNSLKYKNPCPLLDGVSEGAYVYFVHSFHAVIREEENLCAYTEYGIDVPAVVSNGTVFGMQFHPEKSGDVGLQMLRNFGKLCSIKEDSL